MPQAHQQSHIKKIMKKSKKKHNIKKTFQNYLITLRTRAKQGLHANKMLKHMQLLLPVVDSIK